VAEFETALELRPDHLPSYDSLVFVYRKRGDLEKVVSTFRRASDFSRSFDPLTLPNLASVDLGS
jgi:Tfp pilus assembly protein PilF